jgi:deferrochelatase/peroxidase EfeB
VVLSPDEDKVGTADPSNSFSHDLGSMQNCPFAAHIIKTNPRTDFFGLIPIIRRGIAFGPEVSPNERRNKKTNAPRGLLFVSYQSSIVGGFRFMQKCRCPSSKEFRTDILILIVWANDAKFPERGAGLDPIIGQGPKGARKISSTDPKSLDAPPLPLDTWVTPKGGEYFFSPSIPVLAMWSGSTKLQPQGPKARL